MLRRTNVDLVRIERINFEVNLPRQFLEISARNPRLILKIYFKKCKINNENLYSYM